MGSDMVAARFGQIDRVEFIVDGSAAFDAKIAGVDAGGLNPSD